MAEKLTQEQIDELLNAISTGVVDEDRTDNPMDDRKIKDYNFRNPKTFTKEQIRTLYIIHDNYARHLSSFLTGLLRTNCVISVTTIEEQKYYEYSNALPETIIMGVLDVLPIEGNMLIEISKQTAYAAIDRLLGGTADSVELQDNISEIELNLMERFIKQLIVFLKEAWASIVDIAPMVNRFETNSRLTQIMPLDETVVIVVMDVKIKNIAGTISICLPCINLENIIGQVSSHFMFSQRRGEASLTEEKRDFLISQIKASVVDMQAVLGNASLTLGEIMHLQTGDVIPLDKRIGSQIEVNIDGKTYFQGDLGTKRHKMAIRVNSVTNNPAINNAV